MAKCKCKICGKQLDTKVAYKIEHISKSGKKTNKYFCSQEEYENDLREKELYRQIQYATDSILGRPITNNARNKEIQELHEVYTYEQILRCIRAKAEDIKGMIAYNKIEGDYQQIRYMMQVIKNCIYDFAREDSKNDWSNYVPQQEEIEIEIEETPSTDFKVKKRKSIF